MKTSRLLFMVVVLLGVTLACDLGAQPPPAATPTSTPKPTPTPKIGGTVFGVQCQPDRLNILHGEAGEIKLVDVEGAGKVTDFRIGSVVPAGQGFTQSPPPNDADGWSPLPGVVQVPPRPVDGPPRTETYYINILLGGSQGAEISGGNIWCQVNVQHTVPPTPTATPTPEAPPVVYTPEDIVLAGFDLFETDSSTSFQDFSDTPIPAGFFDTGSEPFAGNINFAGVPIDPPQLGTTDTIVQRQTDALLPPPYPSSDTIPIELVELSLVSVEPIVVQVGRTTQVWNVNVGVSPVVNSTGEMTITKVDNGGGTFTSELRVQPLFTFTRVADGAVRQLDTGVLGLPPLEFVAKDVPWRRTCPPEVLEVPGVTTEFFCASVDDEGKVLTEEQARLAKHGVRPGQPEPPFIITDDGFRIIYTGPLQAQTGGRLEATFQMLTPDGLPAKGTLAASLGDPPSDRKASHASGELDTEGKVTLFFDVNWPAGTTKLYISHGGKIYEVTEITINP